MYPGRHAAEAPDRPALIMAESGNVITYGQFESGANQIAHLLRTSGLRRGDHIALLLENDPALLMASAAAERTGLVYTPISNHLSTEQIAYIVNDCQAGLVVVSAKTLPLALNLPQACPKVDRWLVANSDAIGLRAVRYHGAVDCSAGSRRGASRPNRRLPSGDGRRA